MGADAYAYILAQAQGGYYRVIRAKHQGASDRNLMLWSLIAIELNEYTVSSVAQGS